MNLAGPWAVYSLCLVTSVVCAVLLARAYRRVGGRLLYMSALAFALLALNNLIVVVDMLFLPGVDLTLLRLATGLLGAGVLLYAFIWEQD